MSKYTIIKRDNGRYVVCMAGMPTPFYATTHDDRASAEAMVASLHLADAAPALLEVLKEVENHLCFIDLGSCGYLEDHIKSAIAAAEGRA